MMTISHNIDEETPQAKAKWFSSLSYAERMDLLCEFTDLILEINPEIVESKNDVQSVTGRICVLSKE